VTLELDHRPELCTAGGVLHGGAIMALADGAAGTCAFLNLPDGASGTATIQSATSFLRPVSAGHVEAVARPLRVGRTVIHLETDVLDADDRLVARVTQSQAVL
jgi:1,4-dihydroxy-2-naphthoyl-CoA hydrolase